MLRGQRTLWRRARARPTITDQAEEGARAGIGLALQWTAWPIAAVDSLPLKPIRTKFIKKENRRLKLMSNTNSTKKTSTQGSRNNQSSEFSSTTTKSKSLRPKIVKKIYKKFILQRTLV